MNLVVKYMTESDCYKAGRKITPRAIMIHSTATPNVMAHEWYSRWNKPGVNACVHAFLDDKETYQYLPWNHRGWHAGGSANNTHIGFEICEPSDLNDAEYFNKIYNNAIELTVMLCKQYGLTEKDVICHCEGYKLGIATNHGDVMHWFPKHGKNMDTFREDVRKVLNANVVSNPQPSQQETPIEKCKKYVGDRCKELQEKLTKVGYDCHGIDGVFGQNTYNSLILFQKDKGLTVDGLAGNATFAKLDEIITEMNKPKPQVNAYDFKSLQGYIGAVQDNIAGQETLSKCPLVKFGSKGNVVKWLQTRLNYLGFNCGNVDGDFGNMTLKALKAFQTKYLGANQADGICGQNSWRKLLGL